jgi:two-component system, cell cycle sensor histidine kinase and response regulator CckA
MLSEQSGPSPLPAEANPPHPSPALPGAVPPVLEQALRGQRDALLELTACIRAPEGTGDRLHRRVVEAVAAALQAERTSIWLKDGHGNLRCLDQYDATARSHSGGRVLKPDAAPAYFAALFAGSPIVAENAAADPRTAELYRSDGDRGTARSILDVPIGAGGSMLGVLRTEHAGSSRRFRPDEETFALAAANLLALHLSDLGRQQAEASAGLRDAALEAAGDAIVITDSRGVVVWANPAFGEVSGWEPEQAIGRTPGAMLRSGEQDDAFYGELWRTVQAGGVWRGVIRNRRRSGEIYTEEMTITPVRGAGGEIANFVAVKSDITERLLLEDRVARSGSLEAAGRVTDLIAGDLNNLLAVIGTAADVSVAGVSGDHPFRSELEEIRQAAGRAAGLVAQLLALSRRRTADPEVLDLGELVAGMLGLLRRLTGSEVEILLERSGDPVLVHATRGELAHLLVNLLVCAREALPGGGTLALKIGTALPSGTPAAAGAPADAAPHVLLSLADAGAGSGDGRDEALFKRFFRAGVGVADDPGLATVRASLARAGGSMDVQGMAGDGTTVTLLFPRAVGEPSRRHEGARPAAPEGGSGRILVVDGETALRVLTARILERAGYEVVQAADGAEALSLMAESPCSFDLLLTEVDVPALSGPELARRATALLPALPVLFTSGHPGNAGAAGDLKGGKAGFLQKPYPAEELTRRVRLLLGAATG